MASPTELNDAETNSNLTNYLKKFIVPMQNYENVLEIEFEFSNNGSENHNNDDEKVYENDAYDFGGNDENIDEFDLENL